MLLPEASQKYQTKIAIPIEGNFLSWFPWIPPGNQLDVVFVVERLVTFSGYTHTRYSSTTASNHWLQHLVREERDKNLLSFELIVALGAGTTTCSVAGRIHSSWPNKYCC